MQPGKSPGSPGDLLQPNRPVPNRLIHETSPYLLQHAYNPVDWYPWGKDAFTRAKNEHKPIFLSIGYSTCHWCHIMAHESFEDPAVAAQLNDAFVCIKVDREERPDIDAVYMEVCQHMTGSGGWPLTIIMTPDKKPFFAGTYFPPTGRYGRIGLADVISRVSTLWQDNNEELIFSADQITHALTSLSLAAGSAPSPDASLLTKGYEELSLRFDPTYGGFGNAPKFPAPHIVLFLMCYWHRTGNSHALLMAEKTLKEIRNGGIYDHIGYGIHRYSTDTRWRVPHFEKMLYDQALMVIACTEAFAATKNPEYRTTAEEIIEYVLRDLRSPDGVFYSAEDADSPEGEGAYYLWTYAGLVEILGEDDAAFAAKIFHVLPSQNTVNDHDAGNASILYLTGSSVTNAREPGQTQPDFDKKLASIRSRLLIARQKRPRPALDTKILADWNALFCAALAKAGKVFSRSEYIDAARGSMQFILTRMRSADNGLMHSYRKELSGTGGFADDYAFTIHALIALYDATFDQRFLADALELNTYFTTHFWDTTHGGYFTISDLAEPLIVRKKETWDGAIPSCNSVALKNLLRLSRMTGVPDLNCRALAQLQFCTETIGTSCSASSSCLCALAFALASKQDVVIVGDPACADTKKMFLALRSLYRPLLIVLFRNTGDVGKDSGILAPFTRDMVMQDGKATAYACLDYTCQAPVTDPVQLRELLDKPGDAGKK